MSTHDWTLPGADGQTIHGTTHHAGPEAHGVLILSHGFKGYKDYGFVPRLAADAAAAGLVTHRFNFSHSGVTNSTELFDRPDLFKKDTWNKQVADLTAVLEATAKGPLAGAGLPVVLYGHSRGGVTSALCASQLDGRQLRPLVGLVLAAAPASAVRLTDEQRAELRDRGKLASPSSRTGQTLWVGVRWLEEAEADPAGHDPLRAVAAVGDLPLLVMHGTGDDTVTPDAAHAYHRVRPDAQLHLIEGAGHTFNAPNPLPLDADVPQATREMIDTAIGFAMGCCRGR
jgi:alpha-beta hydrolase superfamily lysophospholipase